MLTKQISEICRVTTHFVGNFMLIKNQVRTQGQNESFGMLKIQKVVTIIIKERLLIRKSCKKLPVIVILFFPWREFPIQDD